MFLEYLVDAVVSKIYFISWQWLNLGEERCRRSQTAAGRHVTVSLP